MSPLKYLYPSRNLLAKLQDRLSLFDKPQTDINNPTVLTPVINITIDGDELLKEPNYDASSVVYSAGAGHKALWSCPDDEVAEITLIHIDSQSALRTITNLYLTESDAQTPGSDAAQYSKPKTQAASQSIEWQRTADGYGRPFKLYPGETIWAEFDVNVAGGSALVGLRYIRIQTKEIPL